MTKMYAVIMAGGTGTRFWPLSTVKHPKQLLSIGTDRPLLNLTIDRIQPLIPYEKQIIITGDAIHDSVAAAAKNIPASNIISEPLRRNTAPCICLAAKIIAERDPNAVMCVLPSDHLIENDKAFLEVLEDAGDLAARENCLITLGIPPKYPETGYGYIEYGEEAGVQNGRPFHQVAAFREKPDYLTAKQYIDQGNFHWNSGMFIWSIQSILSAMETYLPEICEAFSEIGSIDNPGTFQVEMRRIYERIEGVSIDYGVMEKAHNIYSFPADIGWNDVGSWTALADMLEHDTDGNVSQGDTVFIDTDGCIVSAHDGVVVTIGAHDLIVVHTEKATLVCERSKAQDIKKVFDMLEAKKLKDYL